LPARALGCVVPAQADHDRLVVFRARGVSYIGGRWQVRRRGAPRRRQTHGRLPATGHRVCAGRVERQLDPEDFDTALLQGLAICGRCGRRMTVRYHTRRGVENSTNTANSSPSQFTAERPSSSQHAVCLTDQTANGLRRSTQTLICSRLRLQLTYAVTCGSPSCLASACARLVSPIPAFPRAARDSLNALSKGGDPMADERYAIDSVRHAGSLQAKVVDVVWPSDDDVRSC
jgi:hypothetical protein